MPLLLPLASATELAGKTGRSASDARLVAAIREASRRFRSAVGHSLQLGEPEVLELSGNGKKALLLPALPLVEVSSVKIDDVELVLGTDYGTKKTKGILTKLSGVWPIGSDNIAVTYTHGYDLTPAGGLLPECPEDIQGAVLGLAEILLTVDAGVQSKTVLGDTVSFGGVATTGSTQEWVDAVANYKIVLSS